MQTVEGHHRAETEALLKPYLTLWEHPVQLILVTSIFKSTGETKEHLHEELVCVAS